MNNTKILAKNLSKTVDQRAISIPPVWIPPLGKDNAESEPSSSTYSDRASVITSGMTQYIVQMLDEAKSTAILCSFLLADETVENAIDEAAARGVRIYLMLACENRLDNDSPDDDFGKQCLDQHNAMLKRFAGKVIIRSAPHYHAKVVLTDAIGPDQSQATGLLLTANLTREALGRNEELAVVLSFPEIEAMVEVFKWAFFENAAHQILDGTSFKSVKPLGEVEHPPGSDYILATTRESNTIRDYALELIKEATRELIIASFGWQENHEVTNAIFDKVREGVKVTILSRIRPVSMETLIKLKSAGAEVLGFKWLHAKAIWNDADKAMVMSANLQDYGLTTGCEAGLKLVGSRAGELRNCLLNFLCKPHQQLLLDTKLGDLTGPVKVWENNEFKDIDIQDRATRVLGPVISNCASDLNQPADIPDINWLDCPAHEIDYKWTVKAPELPKGAKEVFWEDKVPVDNEASGKEKKKKNKKQKKPEIVERSYSPKVYRIADGNRVIAITRADQIPSAISLRDEKFPGANIVTVPG